MAEAFKNTTNHTHQDDHCHRRGIDLPAHPSRLQLGSYPMLLVSRDRYPRQDETLRSTHVVLKSPVPLPVETDRRGDVDGPDRTAQHHISTTATTSQAIGILLLEASTA